MKAKKGLMISWCEMWCFISIMFFQPFKREKSHSLLFPTNCYLQSSVLLVQPMGCVSEKAPILCGPFLVPEDDRIMLSGFMSHLEIVSVKLLFGRTLLSHTAERC